MFQLVSTLCARALLSFILLAFFALAIVACGSCSTRGQCSGGSCAPAPAFRFPPARPSAPAKKAKKKMPQRPVRPALANYGLDVEKQLKSGVGRTPGKSRYHINGKEVNKAAAYQAVAEADIPADAGKRRLTIIGTKAEQDVVLADLNTPALLPYKNDLVIQAYTPDTPMIQGVGFDLAGHPSVMCQAAAGMSCLVSEEQADGSLKTVRKTAKGGEVLFRNKDGAYPGAEKLVAALRRTDPTRDPSKDPDVVPPAPKGPSLPSLPFDPASIPPVAYGLGAVAAFLLLKGAKS